MISNVAWFDRNEKSKEFGRINRYPPMEDVVVLIDSGMHNIREYSLALIKDHDPYLICNLFVVTKAFMKLV